ncbi:type II secretion system protein [Candidatus Gracilibacteria bacterium]|nr:type II secretion system protein [Candidatus Gracilibacteria bacterium]
MKKNGFTLAEILIVVILFGMLAGIIIKTYTTISQVSFRLQQEKEIAKEALVLSQVLDNLAQSTTIDYGKYQSSDLVANNGVVDTLYLKGDNGGEYQISSINTCLTDQEFDEQVEKSEPKTENQKEEPPCQLSLTTTQDGKTTHLLLDGKNFKLSKMQFKIIPFIGKEDLKKNLASETPQDGKPAFRLLGTLYSHFYNPNKWTNNISLPLQFFFSLQGKTESLYSITDENATQSSEA